MGENVSIREASFSEIRARAVSRAIDGVRPLVAGRIEGGAPKTVLRSVVEHSHRPEVSRHIEDIVLARPARIEDYPLADELPAHFRRQKAFDPVFTYRLRDVVVSPASGLVWLEDEGLAFLESVGSLYRLLGWERSLWQTRLVPVDGPEVAVALSSTGYYHWLLEVVPSYLHSTRSLTTPAVTILPHRRLGATENLLDHAGVPTSRRFESQRPVRVKHLTLTGIPGISGFIGRSEVDVLREWHRPSSVDGSADLHVYLSRRRAAKRSMGNEQELEETLAQRGFRIVYAEDLTLLEQADLFSRARVVVAPHGAGLSNLVWRRGPCHVLEVFPADFHNDCFARLSVMLGFTYEHISCNRDDHSAGVVHIPSVTSRLSEIGL